MIGIDLGTTNSCVAVRDPFGGIKTVAVATGNEPPFDTVLRSAVLDPENERKFWVGDEAVQKSRTKKNLRLLVAFKPFLDEHQLRRRERQKVGETSEFDQVGQAEVTVEQFATAWEGGEERFSRGELVRGCAALLSHLLQKAIAEGGDPSQIWIGMPVSFSTCARQRVLAALRMSWDERGKGYFTSYADVLSRVRFVLEPVAVSAGPIMRDAHAPKDIETVMVFDHGGGTLDLSIIRYEHRADMGGLVPVKELAAAGSRDVAGRSIDAAFRGFLSGRDDFAKRSKKQLDHIVDGFVEACKIELSEAPEALALPGVMVSREELETAVAPILDDIERLMADVLANADLAIGEIDRVVMTGGSSLVPCVQARVASMFPDLDEYHLLSYDPTSHDDKESAITEVARGLVAFAEATLEHVVLWDVFLSIAGRQKFCKVIERGQAYQRDKDGNLFLRVRKQLPPMPGQGTSFGLYEHQLTYRYLFGITDIPPLPNGGILEIELRPQRLTPTIRVLCPDGQPLQRDQGPVRHPGDELTVADLQSLNEETELLAYFNDDTGYHPSRGFEHFECAPLTRTLRLGDLVEHAYDVDGDGPGRKVRRRRGELVGIYHDDEPVREMRSHILEEHRFDIRLDSHSFLPRLRARSGSLRLAARPGKSY